MLFKYLFRGLCACLFVLSFHAHASFLGSDWQPPESDTPVSSTSGCDG